MLSICLFFLSVSPSVVFGSYLAAPKCQEQKGEKERNYRADYSWGLADKMLMSKLKPILVFLFSHCDICVFFMCP